jgi:hypothetical protein
MTDYPVTKEELEQIRFGCDATKMMEEVLSRPDPLALLDKWLYVQYELSGEIDIQKVRLFVKLLRTNPEAVREQGIKEGW